MKTISYYELLEMVKVGNVPKRIKVNVCSYSCEYVAEYDVEDFSYYYIADEELADENYKYYLSECFLESTMFDKCIEIIEKQDKLMPKHLTNEFIQNLNGEIGAGDIKCIAHKVNEIINYLQHISKEKE